MSKPDAELPPPVKLLLAQTPTLQRVAQPPVALQALDGALLSWLALEGPTPRARLATLLWPDSDADAARNSLRQRLFRLKRVCGVDLVCGSHTLALADGVTHDLDDADTVLGGDTACFGAELERWFDMQRARRRQRLHESLVELGEMAEKAGDWPDALAYARELLALAPLSEEAHRRVIRLHYLAGERSTALLAFDHCEQVLKDEAGTRPSPQTLALLETVQRADDVLPALRPGARMPASVQRPPRLVAREREWQALQQAWDAGRLVVICGEGGLGKTRLAADFARAQGRHDRRDGTQPDHGSEIAKITARTAAGTAAGALSDFCATTLLVSARPGDERVPHASFSRLLRALPRGLWHTLTPALRTELTRLLPELGDAPPPMQGSAERSRFIHAVGALFAQDELATLCLVFDDLHFADDASIELLQAVLTTSRARWLVTARAGEVSASGRRLLDGVLAAPAALHITLVPLGMEQVAELVDSLDLPGLQGDAVAPALLRHGGGNPLYLLETLKAWLEQAGAPWPAQLPAAPGLRAMIERRLTRLSAQAVQLARCAAVAAPDFSIQLAAHVLGRRTIELADPWAELEAAQLLTDGAFAHDLIHEAALASVPVVVARQLHAEIAAYLHTRDGEPVRLARHWALAACWAQAGDAYCAAAQRSRDAARLVEQTALLADAADCFDRAGLGQQRFDALVQRAHVLAENQLGPPASEAADMLAALAAQSGHAGQRLEALDVRLALAINRGESSDTLRTGREAMAAAHALGRADLELRFALAVADALCDLRQAGDAVVVLEPYAAWVHEHADIELRWDYWNAMALTLDYAGRLRDAMPAWDAASAAAQRSARRDMVWKTMASAASTLAKMGLVQRAAEQGQRAHQLALAAGGVTLRVLQSQVTFAHRLRDLGRYSQALPLLEGALAGFEQGGSTSIIARAEHRLAQLFQQLGQPARALQLLAGPRTGLARGLATMQLVHRADVAHQLGRDGLPLMREALEMSPNTDDIYHHIATLFATRLVPPDEGEAMATGLAAWASARERQGVALAGHVRAAACALQQGAAARALPHAQAALHLSAGHEPDSFYLPEMWLVLARAHQALGHAESARRAAADGLAWVQRVHQTDVPANFQDSFLHRNPVNFQLLALAAQLAVPLGV